MNGLVPEIQRFINACNNNNNTHNQALHCKLFLKIRNKHRAAYLNKICFHNDRGVGVGGPTLILKSKYVICLGTNL